MIIITNGDNNTHDTTYIITYIQSTKVCPLQERARHDAGRGGSAVLRRLLVLYFEDVLVGFIGMA